LAQYLELTDINQLWVADLTYLRLEQEFAYLAVILDAYSRRVIGWALGSSLEFQLTLNALEQAIATRQPSAGLVHHSDQGVQYASQTYVSRLEECGAVMSMSRPGSPWENGKCESFIRRSNTKNWMAGRIVHSSNCERMLQRSSSRSTT
jgi:putative transposase